MVGLEPTLPLQETDFKSVAAAITPHHHNQIVKLLGWLCKVFPRQLGNFIQNNLLVQ